jgi:NAD(P)-dependent dehydrogenase (short-subunit alcohol dehydrogenase family)
MADYDAADRGTDRAVNELGGLDILVKNAAYQMSQDGIESITAEQFDRVLKTNLYAMFWLCAAVVL